ncbi:MAG: peptidoglycan DD-metalloendopeptidase family protein [Candidatus Gastranaerophilales bacterium]|nr:peptidoglycan DD-metalloendopeptidase family protein [Candidatus Gastranaerophilales bacterium]
MSLKSKILVLVCVFLLFVIQSVSFAALTYNDAVKGTVSNDKIHKVKDNIEKKRQNTRQKIRELKVKENKEINKLYKSQGNMEITKKELLMTQQNLEQTKARLTKLQQNLNEANAKYEADQNEVAKRLREIYKGERISFLNVIFLSENINKLLDKVYYQQIIAQKDTEALISLKANASKLADYTRQVNTQRQSILYSMARIQDKKDKIAQDINTSQYLINKLQTDRRTYERAEKELANQSESLARMLRGTAKKQSSKFSTTTDFSRPVAGPITSPFGWRIHPIFRSRTFHAGVDIGAPYGTPVRATNSGVVIYAGWYGGYGKVVIIDHGNYKGKPTSTLYAHLSRYSVNQGASISKGQTVGYVGSTGYSTGPHLHYEVRINGNPTNPF